MKKSSVCLCLAMMLTAGIIFSTADAGRPKRTKKPAVVKTVPVITVPLTVEASKPLTPEVKAIQAPVAGMKIEEVSKETVEITPPAGSSFPRLKDLPPGTQIINGKIIIRKDVLPGGDKFTTLESR